MSLLPRSASKLSMRSISCGNLLTKMFRTLTACSRLMFLSLFMLGSSVELSLCTGAELCGALKSLVRLHMTDQMR